MKVVLGIILFTVATGFSTVVGNFNGDCGVDLEDLLILVADWLNETPYITVPAVDINGDDKVDINDFALFSAHWQEIDANCVPVDEDSEVFVTTHLISGVALNASITGPETLSYVVTSLPAKGHLRQIGGQIITSVPKTLNSNLLCYETVENASTSFNWKATTGVYDSDGATVTLTVSAHPKDHLSFGKEGTVTISDADLFDLTGNRGIALFIRTYANDCPILTKLESGGKNGYTLSLIDGKPTLQLYNSSGLINTITYPDRINDGQWYNLGFAYDPSENKAWLGTQYNYTDWVDISSDDFTNSESLVVGNGFWWDIDNIRTYAFTDYTTNIYNWAGFVDVSTEGFIQTRQNAGDGNIAMGITVHPAADVRFKCDYDGTNNTASQIYDDKSNHYTGSINSRRYVRYYPFFIEPCKN